MKNKKLTYEEVLKFIIADIKRQAKKMGVTPEVAMEGYLEGLRDDVINSDDL